MCEWTLKKNIWRGDYTIVHTLVAFFTKEVNPRLAKRPLVFNGRLVNRGLTFLIKEATDKSTY